MAHQIDIDGLASALKHAESMVAYYGPSEIKSAQNAALAAAGLPPMHSPQSLGWDRENEARHQRHADAIRAAIAALGGELKAEAA